MISLFTHGYACRSRAHCLACREDSGWRARVGAPDICPHGLPSIDAAQAHGRERAAQRRLKVCETCPHRKGSERAPCAGCWCGLLVDADGRPDRRAYKRVLGGKASPPAGCPLDPEGAETP